jgi:hypothetical protein
VEQKQETVTVLTSSQTEQDMLYGDTAPSSCQCANNLGSKDGKALSVQGGVLDLASSGEYASVRKHVRVLRKARTQACLPLPVSRSMTPWSAFLIHLGFHRTVRRLPYHCYTPLLRRLSLLGRFYVGAR